METGLRHWNHFLPYKSYSKCQWHPYLVFFVFWGLYLYQTSVGSSFQQVFDPNMSFHLWYTAIHTVQILNYHEYVSRLQRDPRRELKGKLECKDSMIAGESDS